MKDSWKRLAASLAFLALASCQAPDEGTDGRNSGLVPAPVWPIPDHHVPEQTSTPISSPTPAPSGYPRPCNAIYGADVLPTFELEVDSSVWSTLQTDFATEVEEWRPAVFRFEGETFEGVTVRNRGNNSRCGDRMQFAIAFHHVDPDQRFKGLRRLDLDHGSCRILYERIAMDFVRDRAGLAAPCANNARLLVNGEFYGIFANLEHPNRDFLERNFAEADGNLYKSAREKKTNEDDPDTSDLDALEAAVTVGELDEVVDLEQAIRMWAAEAVLPAADNYWYFGRNYYVYGHPTRGFVYVPNDYDHALPLSWNWDWAPMPPRSDVAIRVLQDPHWNEVFHDEIAEIHELFAPEWFDETLDRYWAQVKDDVEADPLIDIDDAHIARLKERFRLREQLLEDAFGL